MDTALWAFGRGSGIVALVLFTAVVVLGIVTRSGRPLPGIPRFAVMLVHRNLTLVATVFLGFHILLLMLDSFAKLNPVDVLVPFLGTTNPFWLGLGTVAFDLMLAVVVTALLRQYIGVRVFRAVHWLSYAMWPVALAHAVGNGTDHGSAWFLPIALACAALVAGAVVWRLSADFREIPGLRVPVRRSGRDE